MTNVNVASKAKLSPSIWGWRNKLVVVVYNKGSKFTNVFAFDVW